MLHTIYTPKLADVKTVAHMETKKMNPGYTWVREEPMRRFELLASGLQIRFQHIAEYCSRSDCAYIEA